jgi:LPS sulfotransferase NodH
MIRSVVIGMARSGTNLLVSLLNSHPEALFYGEIFHERSIRTFDREIELIEASYGQNAQAMRDRDPAGFLEIFFRYARQDRKILGFKIFANHFPEVQNQLIQDPACRVLLLERQNRLAAFSSAQIGQQTGVWHTTGKAPETVKIDFSASEFSRFCKFTDRTYKDVRERLDRRGEYLDLRYQDLLLDGTHVAIKRHLDIAEAPRLSSPLTKQNPARPIDRFMNPDEVRRSLDLLGHPEWALEG